jgi:hypothetical protein
MYYDHHLHDSAVTQRLALPVAVPRCFIVSTISTLSQLELPLGAVALSVQPVSAPEAAERRRRIMMFGDLVGRRLMRRVPGRAASGCQPECTGSPPPPPNALRLASMASMESIGAAARAALQCQWHWQAATGRLSLRLRLSSG